MNDFFNKKEQSELIEGLNSDLSKHRAVFEDDMLEQIREVENPILVDIDDTVIWGAVNYGLAKITNYSDRNNHTALPGAAQFLNSIEEIGTIIFVTHSKRYANQQQRLEQAGLWKKSRLVFAAENYFTSGHEEDVREILSDYFAKYTDLDSSYFGKSQYPSYDMLSNVGVFKSLAPVFNSISLPLIDNEPANLKGPGIMGLRIAQYPPMSHRYWAETNELALSYEQIYHQLLLHYAK